MENKSCGKPHNLETHQLDGSTKSNKTIKVPMGFSNPLSEQEKWQNLILH